MHLRCMIEISHRWYANKFFFTEFVLSLRNTFRIEINEKKQHEIKLPRLSERNYSRRAIEIHMNRYKTRVYWCRNTFKFYTKFYTNTVIKRWKAILIWYNKIDLSNINNLRRVVWFQVFLYNTNYHLVSSCWVSKMVIPVYGVSEWEALCDWIY